MMQYPTNIKLFIVRTKIREDLFNFAWQFSNLILTLQET
jgi:hypothetical protein